MPRDVRWSAADSDPEWDDEDDDYGPDDQSPTTDCIKCGSEIYDDAACCPICGEYQVGERTMTAWEGRPFWWKLGGLLGILAVLFAMLAFCF